MKISNGLGVKCQKQAVHKKFGKKEVLVQETQVSNMPRKITIFQQKIWSKLEISVSEVVEPAPKRYLEPWLPLKAFLNALGSRLKDQI